MFSKAEEFSIDEQSLGECFKALSHPARIAIIKHLAQTGSCFSGDIAEVIPLGRSTVSQHLTQLKDADLIKGRISGPRICYCLNSEKWNKIKLLISSLLEQVAADSNTQTCS